MNPAMRLTSRKSPISALALVLLLIVTSACMTSGDARAATGDVTLPLCSQAVHDSYRVQGPDGVWYPSWHPQVDAENNCHFDHEHGSNPALVGPVTWLYGTSLVPAYGYTATKAGMTEGHAGFKTYVFQLQGYTWMITHHFGTGSPQVAACNRFHTFDLVIVDSSGVVKVNVHFMGDYGPAIAIDGAGDLTPTACPNQAANARAAGSTGVRQIPVGTSGNGSTLYEPW